MKLNIMLHALTSGIMYKVRTVECGNQQFSVWRVWNIPQGISRYGISNNDRTPKTFYDCQESEVFSRAVGDAYNELANTTRDVSYYEKLIRDLLVASHRYAKEVSR